MTQNVISTVPSVRRFNMAALVGGALLVASVGVGAGWLMRSHSPASPTANVAAETAPQTTSVAAAEPASETNQTRARTETARKPQPVRSSPAPQRSSPVPTAEPTPVATRPVAVCHDCGVIEGVREVKQKGDANGIGAVAGGVLGGAIGNQMGSGNGRKAMTVIGAIGGGLAGHEVEKRVRGETVYEVRVRMDDGSLRTVTQKTQPTPGSRVIVDGDALRVVSSGGSDAPRTLRTSTGV